LKIYDFIKVYDFINNYEFGNLSKWLLIQCPKLYATVASDKIPEKFGLMITPLLR